MIRRARDRFGIDGALGALLQDSGLIVVMTALMSAAGGLFWVVAARLQSPEAVGVAGSLVSGLVSLSMIAQVGLKDTLVRALPSSDDPSADIVSAIGATALVGTLLGLGYAAVVPLFSADLAVLHESVWHAAGFAVMAGATAANVTSDAAFLSLRKVGWDLVINGIVMSVPKLGLPFLLVSWGDFGLAASVGIASLVAAVVSVAALVVHVGRPRRARPSPALRRSVRFAMASYVATLCDLAPVLLIPLIVIGAVGPAPAAVYFVGFQILLLLNAGAYAVGGSMYAHGSREPARRTEILRHGGLVLGAAVVAGAAVLALVAPLLLSVFGPHYADHGTSTLRVLALSAIGVALNYWAITRLRLSGTLRALMTAAAITNLLVLAAVWALAPLGIVWVAAGYSLGQVVGGLVAVWISGRSQVPSDRDATRPGAADPDAAADATEAETADPGAGGAGQADAAVATRGRS